MGRARSTVPDPGARGAGACARAGAQVPRAADPGLVLDGARGRRHPPLADHPAAARGLLRAGGRAAYPSTVIMTAAVARLAGVPEVIVATPPRRDGTILPEVAAAARLAGATRILLCG